MSASELPLTLGQAEAGMTLARDLRDAKGQVLMSQGTKLSASAISALSRRGLTEQLWVLSPQPPAPDLKAQEAVVRQQHRERLARVFRHVGEGPDDCYLRDIMTRYRGLEPS